MTAMIIDGHAIAEKIKIHIAHQIKQRHEQKKSTPCLAVILVGNHPASAVYVSNKHKACEIVGIQSRCYTFSDTVDEKIIYSLIDSLNQDKTVHGILVQLPLPIHILPANVLDRIHPLKDVDGFHPYNLGRLAQRRPQLRPCTSYGVMTLLQETGECITGKHALVVGASNIVGRPMALELLLADATVTICHRFTRNLSMHIQSADILISATGYVGVIHSDWIKPGAIVIDVGFSRLSNGKISGDIDFETASVRAKWITPVPGGVGPMTVATLLQNTLLAATLQDDAV